MPAPSLLTLALALFGPADDPPVDYTREVQPILSAHCYECHGPDAHGRKAGLRLDRAQDALGERAGGAVIVPRDPGASVLIERILADDPRELMPPPHAKKPLSEGQRETLRRWVDQGARFETHWSFTAPTKAELPVVQDERWPRQPIDRFVLRRLEDGGWPPSAEAEPSTLLRRVHLALTGLPPTPEERAAFLADPRPDAYERVVDELLTRSSHAERMTLAWMDAARYGDTSVFHADGPRDMWPWRDWVIAAYRDNMPFDRFSEWQIAGDLLPDASEASRVATGFNRNHGTTDEGGAIAEEFRVEYVVDRVKTTANVWLGLTMECSQCHDHKYDPISQEEYYRFFAFFNQGADTGMQTRDGNAPPLVQAPSPEHQRALSSAEVELQQRQAAFAAAIPPADELSRWIETERAALRSQDRPVAGPWSQLGPFSFANRGEAFRAELVDPAAVDLGATVQEQRWIEKPDYPSGSPHALALPNNSAVYLYRRIEVQQAGPRSISLGSDDTIQVWVNGALALAKDVGRGVAADQDRIDVPLHAGTNHFLMKVCNGGGAAGYYFEILGSTYPDEVAAALLAEDCGPDTEHHARLQAYYTRNQWPAGVELFQAQQVAEQRLAELRAATPTVMIMGDLEQPRATYLLDRGQYDAPRKDKALEPGTPGFLPPMDEALPRNRLGLARWITDPRHPLTARVAVNRYWALIFGQGLVETAMDFGAQGARPTHPALLDWLAADFVEHGWDVRRILRMLVLSATFRQSSASTPRHRAEDPRNLLLGRSPRLRLQGEFVRDQALAISGLLVDQVGGPGVKPYQPDGLWNEVSLNGGLRFQRDEGEALYRKSMYIYWKRSAPMPVMTIFDAPTREKCVVLRGRTNTPLQALVTLNDVQFVEAARHLARRMLREGGDSFEARLDHGFLLATARPADALRRQVFRETLDAELAAFRAAPDRAEALLAFGESARDAGLDPVEHAAWTVLASMLLNLDETLNRE